MEKTVVIRDNQIMTKLPTEQKRHREKLTSGIMYHATINEIAELIRYLNKSYHMDDTFDFCHIKEVLVAMGKRQKC